jgi:hypothetical protein
MKTINQYAIGASAAIMLLSLVGCTVIGAGIGAAAGSGTSVGVVGGAVIGGVVGYGVGR